MSNLSEEERAALIDAIPYITLRSEVFTDLPDAFKELFAFHNLIKTATLNGEKVPEPEKGSWPRRAAEAVCRIRELGIEMRGYALYNNYETNVSPLVDLCGTPADELALARAWTEYQKFLQEHEVRAAKGRAGDGKPPAEAVPDGFYSPGDIAKAIKAPRKTEAIRKELKRLFDADRIPGTAWIENGDPAKGQARILYRLSVVRPLLSRFEHPASV